MEAGVPLVSVVIPTLNRPQLLARAVRSALAQTLEALEVIVVIDGLDMATRDVFTTLRDPRLSVMQLPRNLGPPEARNAGIDAAHGRWIAFLDHDDEWLPEKLRIQYEAARRCSAQHPIVSCRFIKRTEAVDVVLPRRLPGPDEPLSEYLLRRTQWVGGEALVQTSTIFTATALLQQVRFRSEAGRHDDLDWLLRASQQHGASLVFVETAKPLAIWHRECEHATISGNKDWRFSCAWIQQNRPLVTSRAYASFLLTWVSANAVEQGDRSALRFLAREAFQMGAPSALDLCVFVGIWLTPPALRRLIAGFFSRSGRRDRACLVG